MRGGAGWIKIQQQSVTARPQSVTRQSEKGPDYMNTEQCLQTTLARFTLWNFNHTMSANVIDVLSDVQ